MAVAATLLALPACGLFGDGGPVQVAAIGTLQPLPNPSLARIGGPDALLLDATARGLVAHDSDGQIESGLADRWTVIDDGRSYIFRLRDAEWVGGRRVVAADVAWALEQRMNAADLPVPLRGEFAAVESIRAMTTKVIEIRLSRPQPHFLDLLAHPALALRRRDAGWGPLRGQRAGRSMVLTLAPDPAMQTAGEAATEAATPIAVLWGTRPAVALAQFNDGSAQAVMGGRFEHWPYLAAAGIADNAIRRDPVDGLFGLAVVSDRGVLAQNLGRDAVAMAIDRASLIDALGVPEWAGRATLRSPRLSPGQRPGALPEPIFPAWIDLNMTQRRAQARSIVAAIVEDQGAPVRLRIAMPEGLGAAILFSRLRADLAAVNVDSVAVPMRADADLRLIDEVAPSDDPLWYLRRLGCRRGLVCDADNDALIAAMAAAPDAVARRTAVAAADEALTRFGGFIPLATPLRWSLVTPRLTGHRPNARGQHSIIRLLPPPD